MTAPWETTASRMAFETEPPAENSAMSTPSNDSGVISCTVSSPAGTWPQPLNGSFLPAERAEASAMTFDAGKSRSCSTFKNSLPTAPVAPQTATTGLAGITLVQAMRSSSFTFRVDISSMMGAFAPHIALRDARRPLPARNGKGAAGCFAPPRLQAALPPYDRPWYASSWARAKAECHTGGRNVEQSGCRQADGATATCPCSSSRRSPPRTAAFPRTRCRSPGRTPYAGSAPRQRSGRRRPPRTGGWATWRWPGC